MLIALVQSKSQEFLYCITIVIDCHIYLAEKKMIWGFTAFTTVFQSFLTIGGCVRSWKIIQMKYSNSLFPEQFTALGGAPVAQWVKRWPKDLADRV